MIRDAAAPLRFSDTLQSDISEVQVGGRRTGMGKSAKPFSLRFYLRKGAFPRDSPGNTGPLLAIKETEVSNFLEKLRLIN